MENLIITALISYILANHRFITMLANATRKITITSKLTTPKQSFDMRTTFKNLTCR